MNSLKTRLAISAVVSALAAGALGAHADSGDARAESRQTENFEHQLSTGSVDSYTPAEHDGSANGGASVQEQKPRAGIFHRVAQSAPVRRKPMRISASVTVVRRRAMAASL